MSREQLAQNVIDAARSVVAFRLDNTKWLLDRIRTNATAATATPYPPDLNVRMKQLRGALEDYDKEPTR